MLLFIEQMIKQLKYQFEKIKRPILSQFKKAVFLFAHNLVLILIHIGCYMDTKNIAFRTILFFTDCGVLDIFKSFVIKANIYFLP